jgi:hypothetical protein
MSGHEFESDGAFNRIVTNETLHCILGRCPIDSDCSIHIIREVNFLMCVSKNGYWWLLLCVVVVTIGYVVGFTRLGTGQYCGESPAVRWRLAIHSGECDAETGCHYLKVENTGVLEYLGIKKFSCREQRPAPEGRWNEEWEVARARIHWVPVFAV